MVPHDKKVLWSFMFLLAGAAAQMIQYQAASTCAVTGSTVTLPCSFTPKKSFHNGMREVPLKIIRARWCKNHLICQGTTPSLYDSDSANNEPRYWYQGDLEGKCTLQIRGVGMQDNATFRFRMEANHSEGHFTNSTGVVITVFDLVKMRINISSSNREFSSGQTVSLQCTTSSCTFNHLEVTWLKDGYALSENGSTLQLSPLTAKDSGNYTCALRSNGGTRSEAFSLQVEAAEEAPDLHLIAGVMFGVLLLIITLILVIFIVKRKRTAPEGPNTVGGETEMKNADNIYSSILMPHQEEAGSQRRQTSQEAEETSYASIKFKHNNWNRKAVQEPDQTIYSLVATRG
ncbi:V-set and immunoglobulin domain-containing protein 2-like [Girardinichthys multiradiatus]|uniref:V-set and immunoglobulin domain-containing protein 2-like n=1 Tax=Girardinichthys multiradiatus TaxID=208333 RepID=UPI001FACC723|nr:V-set and immunoglobulin domain-containing protein 2-like [Girardinichthys multiradiatus]